MKNHTTQNVSHEIVPGEIGDDLLAPYWRQVREKLFPLLEIEGAPPLTDKLKTLDQVLEVVRIEEFVAAAEEGKRGGQQINRRPIARAFLAKAFLNLSQKRALKEQLHQSDSLRQLCGMENVPSERPSAAPLPSSHGRTSGIWLISRSWKSSSPLRS